MVISQAKEEKQHTVLKTFEFEKWTSNADVNKNNRITTDTFPSV